MRISGKRLSKLAPVLLVVFLAGCSGLGGGADKGGVEDLTAREIFDQGEFELASDNIEKAADLFAEVERLYPYSELAPRALVMQAFAFHKARDYEKSRAAAQRYVDNYPASEDAAYAQYLLALSYYDQIDDIGRDQRLTFQALQALRLVTERHPDSEWARSAMAKFDLAFNHLAAKEMEVGRYYLKRQHYTASINRFRVVVEDFQTTTHTPEALFRLVEAYLSLGLTNEAQTAGAILGHNFQATEWYEDAFALLTQQGLSAEAEGTGWLPSIYRRMIRGDWL